MKNIPVKSKRFFVLTCLLSSLESVALSLSVYYTAQILEFAQEGQRESMIWRIVIATGLLLSAYLLHAGSTAARLGYLSHAEVCLKRDIMKNVLQRPWQGFQRRNRAYGHVPHRPDGHHSSDLQLWDFCRCGFCDAMLDEHVAVRGGNPGVDSAVNL